MKTKKYYWSKVQYIRWGSLFFMLGFPFLGIVLNEIFNLSNWIFLIYTLIYGFIIFYLFFKPLFKLNCPKCGQLFFIQPGQYIWFVKCNSCGIKIGSQD